MEVHTHIIYPGGSKVRAFVRPGGGRLWSSRQLREVARLSDTDYTLLCLTPEMPQWGLYGLNRILGIARDASAGITYADGYRLEAGRLIPRPLIDYRRGSLRDDFDFGALMLFHTPTLKATVEEMTADYLFAGLYDLRLGVSRRSTIVHIGEYLYTCATGKESPQGGKQFEYVDPRNRDVQLEMEQACTHHLKQTGAYLPARTKTVDIDEEKFDAEASVIIPVRNRLRTIAQAIDSVMSQETNFAFNLIVVDNHSTDGTTEAIRRFNCDRRLIHLLPRRRDLGIGGCWNMAVRHPSCGRFAVQLDSDDLYSSPHVLQQIVDAFRSMSCAMLVGSYMLTDFNLNPLPPGLIDHREWTADNGHNNALRINGLGAPRAFFTPLLRKLHLPNTSYGEDYAAGLRISREYLVGRIYDALYLCRRWDDNSDASQDVELANAHDAYKDALRTWELEARIQLNIQNENRHMD